jgi:hypothetical protein
LRGGEARGRGRRCLSGRGVDRVFARRRALAGGALIVFFIVLLSVMATRRATKLKTALK